MSVPKILIIEDEVLIAEHIKKYLIDFGYTEIYLAHNTRIALEAINKIQPDLVLLDIQLQGPNDGILIAKEIDLNYKIPYLFITANTDMLVLQKAVLTKTIGYITKPVKKTDLFASIQLALKTEAAKTESFILIKDQSGNNKVNLNEIKFIEGNGNYINIHTKDKKHITRHTFDWVQQQLTESHFIRVHRSFLVNMHHVTRKSATAIFIDETEIPFSRTYLPKLSVYLKMKQ